MAALEHLVDRLPERLLMPKSCVITLSSDKLEALLRTPCFSVSSLNSWVPRRRLQSPKRLIKLRRTALPPIYCVVYQLAVNAVFQESSPIAIIMVPVLSDFSDLIKEASSHSPSPVWCNWEGKTHSWAGPLPSIQSVASSQHYANATQIPFRDPDHFIAANLQNHLPAWESILVGHPKADELFGYLSLGVDVRDFLVHFKGYFQGRYSRTLEIVRTTKISSPPVSLIASRMVPF
ncbi:hypothetical protein OS493_015244 [Desmophyllum pertusum]|uniref:Uncharacterized protein n=1 Tax=Desmophyllum pertusum TaxID=174260 RepID=A0A9W9ZDE3_9CNID|nr:hypothetical protein OS493_015244 [Desmophyllum pertusum]